MECPENNRIQVMFSSIEGYNQIFEKLSISISINLAHYLIFEEDSYCDNSENDSDGRDANRDNGEN